ncbi:MAG: S9 family peptidase, partial [Rhizobiaceae bacterium]|nr:S9 family peptidase [Rhizobiaceae bacterium]
MRFEPGKVSPPIAERRSITSTIHDISREDDYGWLRAENWQQVMRDPDVLAADMRNYLEAENEYQHEQMADTASLQSELFDEMKGRIKEDDSSIPMKDGEWAYGVTFVTGGEHAKFIRVHVAGEEKNTILDGDKEAEGFSYFRIGAVTHSPNHKFVAWACDDNGSEYYTIKFRNLDTGVDLDKTVPESNGGGVWTKNSDGFVYCHLDDNHRPSKMFFHNPAKPGDSDVLIYEERDAGFFMSASKSQSGDWIIVDIHDHQTSEAWLLPAQNPLATMQIVAKRETGIEYSIDEGKGILYILTNRDDAKDFKIVTAGAENPGIENWRDLVAHKPGRLILSHGIYANHLVWLERENGLPRIIVFRLSDGAQHAIEFDEEAYSLGLSGAYEFDTDVIRFTYSSMTTPSQSYEYNMETRERRLLKTQEVPSGHNIADYVTRRVQVPAADGELVPVSLLFHKDTPIDGSAPCLLYGYGAYGMSMPAAFNTNILSLVDRGFIYAIAHIRGGKEKGFDWYDKGRRQFKTNSFTDFISAGEYLAEQKYTGVGKIVAHGGSAGGMLMGAVANIAPHLFAGIIGEVPFVDVLNTMLDETLPLTPPEWPEWGNPITSKQDYLNIASYSPYDQVRAMDYPPILAIG